MVSILTAGDKHFFRHVETMKEQTGIGLNLWGINPLEVTHFKAGFLGVPPDFEEERVYTHGAMKQLRYQCLRLRAMLQSPGYFNRSLWDTLSGEYYRSFTEKSDYFHIFDYWRWDEDQVEDTLDLYDWERAPDTQHHVAHRRRHRRVLQLRLLHRRRVHRARHLPEQPDPRGRARPSRGARAGQDRERSRATRTSSGTSTRWAWSSNR